jgi:hypothetical protein
VIAYESDYFGYFKKNNPKKYIEQTIAKEQLFGIINRPFVRSWSFCYFGFAETRELLASASKVVI